ncbi:hypothetical protein AB0333_15765 [Citricoccus sp. NPDC079358]|uniref:hypothetical protein n=1 Tax=Citricoccus sp. NPDC079358 TaxID=3154653 RepID=UPI00344B64E4
MRFDWKQRPTRTVAWLIAVAMTFNIVAQILMLSSMDRGLHGVHWALLVVSIFLWGYAVYHLVRKRPPEEADRR